jgi:hypothetical protein
MIALLRIHALVRTARLFTGMASAAERFSRRGDRSARGMIAAASRQTRRLQLGLLMAARSPKQNQRMF